MSRLWIPLKVSVANFQTSVQLVAGDLIGREDSESLRVHDDDFGEVFSDSFHGRDGRPAFDTECLPLGKVERFVALV